MGWEWRRVDMKVNGYGWERIEGHKEWYIGETRKGGHALVL